MTVAISTFPGGPRSAPSVPELSRENCLSATPRVSRQILLRPANGKWSNANAALLEGHYRPTEEFFLNDRKVCEQKPHLLSWSAAGTPAEQDERGFRFSAQREQGAKIGICGDHSPVLGFRQRHYILVIGSLEVTVSDMDSVMPGPTQLGSYQRGQCIVYEEPHEPVRSGSSRSLTVSAANRSASLISSGSRSG